MPRRRVALVGFRHEAMISCPFLTGPSTTHIHRRQEMRDAMYSPAAGALARLDEERDYEAVPLLVARSLPGGPFERSFYDALKAESLTLLQDEGPFDGIVVAPMILVGLWALSGAHFFWPVIPLAFLALMLVKHGCWAWGLGGALTGAALVALGSML